MTRQDLENTLREIVEEAQRYGKLTEAQSEIAQKLYQLKGVMEMSRDEDKSITTYLQAQYTALENKLNAESRELR